MSTTGHHGNRKGRDCGIRIAMNAHHFVAVLLLVTALMWLAVPNDARLIAPPVFLLAAFCFLMAARGKSRQ
jgi:hypothetical protein